MKENTVGSTETTEQGANQQLPLPGVKLGICNVFASKNISKIQQTECLK